MRREGDAFFYFSFLFFLIILIIIIIMISAANLGWPALIINDAWHLRYPSHTSHSSSLSSLSIKLPNYLELHSKDMMNYRRHSIMSSLPEEYRLIRLSIETTMNLGFSLQCLRENHFDYDRALANFEDVKSKNLLPPEAFFHESASTNTTAASSSLSSSTCS
jgi:hypothetical protein